MFRKECFEYPFSTYIIQTFSALQHAMMQIILSLKKYLLYDSDKKSKSILNISEIMARLIFALQKLRVFPPSKIILLCNYFLFRNLYLERTLK